MLFITLIPLFGAGYMIFTHSRKILINDTLNSIKFSLNLFSHKINSNLNTFYSDIKFGSTTYAIQDLLRNTDPNDEAFEKSLNNCEINASAFMKSKPDYLQVRILNERGFEIQRLDRLSGKITIISKDELQDKSNRDYFKVLQLMNPGDFYISDLNLNQEHGSVVKPYLPVIRYATPLLSTNNQHKFYLIFNVDAGVILSHFASFSDTTYILDQDGFYIYHPDPAYRWSKDLGSNKIFHQEFPGFKHLINSPQNEDTTYLPDSKKIVGFSRIYFDPENRTRFWTLLRILPESDVFHDIDELQKKAFLGTSFIGVCVIIISIFFIRRFTDPIHKLATACDTISTGNLDVEVHLDRADELGRFSQTFNTMIQKLKNSNFQLQSQYKTKTLVNELMNDAQGIHLLNVLCDTMIVKLSHLLHVGYGAFYLRKFNEGVKLNKFYLAGSYGFPDSTALRQTFLLGETLAGQCALTKNVIKLNDLPTDYLRIQSGLGEKKPEFLFIVPVLFEKDTIGVIELASFKEFSIDEEELLLQISGSLGVIIHNIISRQETERLLSISQNMEEELRVQQEELQTSNAELEARTEMLETQKNDIEIKNLELEKAHRDIESKANALAIASRYKSEFLANMSHELRTPLNSLLILSELFAGNEDGNLTQSQQEEARIIHEGALELLHLINNILDLSKIEAGKMSVEAEQINIDDLVNNLARQFKLLAKKKNVEFKFDKSPLLPDSFITDLIRVNQTLKNLLSNALKFTEKGTITFSIFPENGILHPEEPCIVFSIKDTGIGIAKDKQSIIFESFQQADGSTSRKYGGTGLGLTICKELAQLLGGRIEFTSILNKGSEFKLILPLCHKPLRINNDSRESDVTHMPHHSGKISPNNTNEIDHRLILIIEDNPQFSKLLADFATANNYKYLIATSGKQGLEIAKSNHPTAIFLDEDLPDLSGVSVLNLLRSGEQTKHIPIHIISGKRESTFTLQEGNIDVLLKPVTKQSLIKVFKRIEETSRQKIKRILLVEDDENCQTVLRKILTDHNIQIDVTGKGEEALHRLITNHYDCVILDLGLPDISGEEILDRLHLSNNLQTPSVIIYTGRMLTREEHQNLLRFTSNIVIKGELSKDRLLDELALFLNNVERKAPLSGYAQQPFDSQFSLQGKRILLVDDDLKNVFALSKVLQKNGIHVIIADNGEIALKKLRENPPFDLIIMDIMMPVMDGYTAIQKIRESNLAPSIAILALTAKAMSEDRDICLQAGANDYLTKPIEIPKLLSSIRVWLSK